jgi:hypothetical protein
MCPAPARAISATTLLSALLIGLPSGTLTRADDTGRVVPADGVRLSAIAPGYARNAVNVTVYRKQSVVTHGDTQFVSFYDGEGRVVLAKRKLGGDAWETKTTSLTGSTSDAHNAINIGVDGDGFLHVAWDHHNNPLNYRRGSQPLSLDLVEAKMTGRAESSVTYPEFHALPGGDLLFLYRDGGSGRGNLAMNRYDVKSRTWHQLSSNLIDGQGQRNAYWQACTYDRGTDGGRTWTRSDGQPYALPIIADTTEYAVRIPQKHELINQTSMTADAHGRPYIATYFRGEGADVPQYFVIFHDGSAWQTKQVTRLTTPFRLGGLGSKRLPLSRPQIVARQQDGRQRLALVFRAEERGNCATLATCDDLSKGEWTFRDLTTTSLGQWEPSYDPVVWRRDGLLHLFVQCAEQVDAEGVGELPPQMVYVAETTP